MIRDRITHREYDVGIFGLGVSGAAAVYNFSRFTNVKSIIALEKALDIATINSHPLNNAQTSHDGSTETNYNLAHALEVQKAARYLRNYLKSKGENPNLYRKVLRMVLGVGAKEAAQLEERFKVFSPYYPDISLASPKWLEQNEPMIMKGRNPTQPISAIVSTEGYVVNYQEYAKELFWDSVKINPNFDYAFNHPVLSIKFKGDHYEVKTLVRTFYCKTVIFEAGPYSLFFARELGYGMNYAILPVAGSFYSAGHLLNNKVYRVQIEGRPFAAIHGDPDILEMTDTRFGPTTKPLPLMERHHYETFRDFMKLPLLSSVRGISALLKVVNENNLWGYAAKNFIFDMPIIGPATFLREIHPIIPTIRYKDLKLRRGAGGIRPQIVNLETRKLEMGDSTIIGKNAIFNTTPSPGASVSMANGRRDAKKIVEFLGSGYWFDEEKFQEELGELPKSA